MLEGGIQARSQHLDVSRRGPLGDAYLGALVLRPHIPKLPMTSTILSKSESLCSGMVFRKAPCPWRERDPACQTGLLLTQVDSVFFGNAQDRKALIHAQSHRVPGSGKSETDKGPVPPGRRWTVCLWHLRRLAIAHSQKLSILLVAFFAPNRYTLGGLGGFSVQDL